VTPRKFSHNKLRETIVGGNKEQVNSKFVIQRICETAAEKEAMHANVCCEWKSPRLLRGSTLVKQQTRWKQPTEPTAERVIGHLPS
jgi:hypothetical protein